MKKLALLILSILFASSIFSQSLQKGNILGVHTRTITLESGVTMEQYLDFYMNKYIPAYEKNFPGIKLYVVKGIRGEAENSYGVVFLIESQKVRDKYWPEQETPSKIAQTGLKNLEPMRVELRKLGTGESTYTDWIIQ